MTTTDTEDLMARGMRCLIANLGVVDATRFISAVLREQGDFAQLRRVYYDAIPPEKPIREPL